MITYMFVKKLYKGVHSMLKAYFSIVHPVGIYLLNVSNGDTRTRYEICSKLTTKTLERRH